MKWVRSLNGVVNLEHVERIYWRKGGKDNLMLIAETAGGMHSTLAEVNLNTAEKQDKTDEEIGREMIAAVMHGGMSAFETPIPT